MKKIKIEDSEDDYDNDTDVIDDEEVDEDDRDEGDETEEEETYLQTLTNEVVDLHEDLVNNYVVDPETP